MKGIRNFESAEVWGSRSAHVELKRLGVLLKHGSFRQGNCQPSQFLHKSSKKLIWKLLCGRNWSSLPVWVTKWAKLYPSLSHPLTPRYAEEGGQFIRSHVYPEDITTTAVQVLFRHKRVSLRTGKSRPVPRKQLPHTSSHLCWAHLMQQTSRLSNYPLKRDKA